MLVLTRKVEQKIQIGPDITITILRVKGQSVRVGVEAPRSVRVLRAELPLHDELPEDAANDEVVSSQPVIRGTIRPKSALVRDRSNAGSTPVNPGTPSMRGAGNRGVASSSGSMRPPIARMATGLSDRVAARRNTLGASVQS